LVFFSFILNSFLSAISAYVYDGLFLLAQIDIGDSQLYFYFFHGIFALFAAFLFFSACALDAM
jgi:hypothetical protein